MINSASNSLQLLIFEQPLVSVLRLFDFWRYSHSGTVLLKSNLGGGGALGVQVVFTTCCLSPEPENLPPEI